MSIQRHKFIAIALAASLTMCAGVSSLAFADDAAAKPVSPIDQALDELQKKPAPVVVAKPVNVPVPQAEPPPLPDDGSAPNANATITTTTTTIAPAAVEVKPPPPVPMTRVVEVQPDTSFFGLSIGLYDGHHSSAAAALNLEWHPSVRIAGFIQPLFGAFVTTRGSVMGYGGVGTPFHLGKHLFVMPSFAVGAYGHGDGPNLGQALVFRAGGEVSYEFDDKSRLGVNAHIVTNGQSFSAKDRGEMIGLVYTMPIDIFSGKPQPEKLGGSMADRAALEDIKKPVK